MTAVHTFTEAIERLAHAPPSHALHFYSDTGDQPELVYYRGLHREVGAAMERLRACGIGPGARVMLPFETDARVLTAFLALVGVGALPLSVKPYLFSGKDEYLAFLSSIGERYHAGHILMTPSLRKLMPPVTPLALDAIVPLDTDFGLEADVRAAVFHRADPGDVAFVQLSSGSTSFPKGVPIRHDRLLDNLRMLDRENLVPADGIASSWLPLFHDMGLIGMLSCVVVHKSFALSTPTRYLMDPVGWLREQGRLRSTGFPTPNFGIDYALRHLRRAEAEELAGMDLSTLRTIYIGSEPINLALLEEFARLLEPYGFSPSALAPCYGMAEAVLIVALDRNANPKAHTLPSGAVSVCLGKPLGDFDVRVARDDGSLAGEREIGEIQLRGGTLADRYFEDPAPLCDPDGYYATGDLGFLINGELHITGRIGDRMKVNGQSHFASHFEHVVESLPFIRPGKSAVFQDAGRVVVLAEVRELRAIRAQRAHAQTVVETLMSHTGVKVAIEDVHFIRYGQLPKTSSGKLRRQSVLHAYQKSEIRDATLLGYVRDRAGRALDRAKRLVFLELDKRRPRRTTQARASSR